MSEKQTNERTAMSKAFQNQCEELWDAIRAYRDAKGLFQTIKACEHLLTLLPENQTEPPTEKDPKEELDKFLKVFPK